jgi:hypothetical protein
MKTADVQLQSVIPVYPTQQSQSKFLTAAEVANILRVTTQSLKLWRKNGGGPPWVKVNNTSVRYYETSLYKWLNCECNPLHSLGIIDQSESIS